MPHELTHASFFSGVGGTDLGLERAGWHTVSFSEVDPYACAVLAERWPGIPNVGDIVRLESGDAVPHGRGAESNTGGKSRPLGRTEPADDRWHGATLWSGGFPCQDLSVAGKRAGFTGQRSVLAFAFLNLVERHRPPAILLENVPGLLSSNGGRDMATLLGRMAELGYGVAYRILDAQHFGVPQRRRRVFILGLRCDPDDADGRLASIRAAEVLSVGARCGRHPATGHETGPGVASGAVPGVDVARSITGTAGKHHDDDTDTLIGTIREHVRPGSNTDFSVLSPSPDSSGVREADGLAGRPHDRVFRKATKAHSSDDWERWESADTADTIGAEGATLAATAIVDVGSYHQRDRIYATQAPSLDAHAHSAGDAPLAWTGGGVSMSLRARPNDAHAEDLMTYVTGAPGDDELLPLGLDSHRYRCCGNGVVAPVAEWLGRRIAEALA